MKARQWAEKYPLVFRVIGFDTVLLLTKRAHTLLPDHRMGRYGLSQADERAGYILRLINEKYTPLERLFLFGIGDL